MCTHVSHVALCTHSSHMHAYIQMASWVSTPTRLWDSIKKTTMPAELRGLPLHALAFSLRYLQALMVTHSLWDCPLALMNMGNKNAIISSFSNGKHSLPDKLRVTCHLMGVCWLAFRKMRPCGRQIQHCTTDKILEHIVWPLTTTLGKAVFCVCTHVNGHASWTKHL